MARGIRQEMFLMRIKSELSWQRGVLAYKKVKMRSFQHHADAEKCVQERKMRSWKKQTEKQGQDTRQISWEYK